MLDPQTNRKVQLVDGTDLATHYEHVRARSVELCRPLAIEDHSAQPIVDVSPPKWHLGHTTWFFEQFLLKASPHYRADDRTAYLFNSYYEGVGARVKREHRGNFTRPVVEQVLEYRARVDEHMLLLISQGLDPKQQAILDLGMNHEQQHQELLITDIKYILCQEPVFPEYGAFTEGWDEKPVTGTVEVPGGIHWVGYEGDGFSFDAEHGRHKVYLEPFRIHSRLVTNREWLEFTKDGGYTDHRHWHSAGWQWLQDNGVKAPLYWYERDGQWHWFSLQGLVQLDLDMPVANISFFEAFAFSQWCGKRLPTEQEWEVASSLFRWGQRWEWTHSAFLPYPGYQRAEGAIGEYNGKFMVDQMVLRGASVATPPGHSRHTYRNFFHPQLRWQYTGLRLVENDT